jgi:uncharacterized protein YecT (DUF1311 family)
MLALSIAALLVQASADTQGRWTNEQGVASASAEIGACLSARRRERQSCVRAAFDVCERQNGTASQRDLNACAVFSYRAWSVRLDAVRIRLAEAAVRRWRDDGKLKHLPSRLAQADRRWRAWSEFDCELSASPSVGGSLHTLELYMCRSNHTALRAVELEILADWWDR